MLLLKYLKIAITSLAIAIASSNAIAEPVIDQPAPSFYGITSEGSTLNLAALKDKIVVLEWTNNECPFVKKHYESGNIPQLQKEAAAKGVVWLQIISSAKDKQGYVDGPTAIKLNESRGAKPAYTILDPEGKIGRLYDAQTSPHLFIINPQGVLVYKGGIDSIASAKQEDIPKATNYVREALAALEAGKKVPNPSTKPYGCSIKYAN
jgi:hypothetical protein